MLIYPQLYLEIPGQILTLGEFWLNSDFRKSLRVEESFHLTKKNIASVMKSLWFQNLCVDLGVNAPVLICYVGGQHHVTGGERPHMNLTIDYKKKFDEKFTSCKAKIPGNF